MTLCHEVPAIGGWLNVRYNILCAHDGSHNVQLLCSPRLYLEVCSSGLCSSNLAADDLLKVICKWLSRPVKTSAPSAQTQSNAKCSCRYKQNLQISEFVVQAFWSLKHDQSHSSVYHQKTAAGQHSTAQHSTAQLTTACHVMAQPKPKAKGNWTSRS